MSELQGEDQPVELMFPSAADFFENWLAPTWEYRSSVSWCPRWWVHPEAVNRITALWLVWEQLRLDPATGMSVFWRDHADYHLGILTSGDGPLAGCGRNGVHRSGEDAADSPLVKADPAPDVVRGIWADIERELREPDPEEASESEAPEGGETWW